MINYLKPVLDKCIKQNKTFQGYFAEYLMNKKEEKKSKKRADEDKEDEYKDKDDEDYISKDVRKKLAESFLNIKEFKFEI